MSDNNKRMGMSLGKDDSNPKASRAKCTSCNKDLKNADVGPSCVVCTGRLQAQVEAQVAADRVLAEQLLRAHEAADARGAAMAEHLQMMLDERANQAQNREGQN